MSDRTAKILNHTTGVAIGEIAAYWPQIIESVKSRGGWWALGGGVLAVVGGSFYHWYMGDST